ncbi:MAG: sigma 54-interacting transcriptional regulator [Myxococcota bacterium]
MNNAPTVPHVAQGRPERRPVRSIRLEVINGPDRGRNWQERSETVTIGTAQDNDLVLSDETVSRYHAELTAVGDQIRLTDQGSTNGTKVGSARIFDGMVERGTVIGLGRTQIRVSDGEAVEVITYERDHLHGIYGRSRPIRELMARVEQAGKTDASVLLLGETGCGKEVVARAIHSASGRAGKPFEVVDCGALMTTLIASELFGHEKGAFTGAHSQYIGAFERADGGTIFLDEIGELSAELQVRLLGVLERRSFRRLGGTKRIDINVRVVSATHRDLREWVNKGDFRQDLYYRIAVARLLIAPLRERREDIPVLVEHFLRQMDLANPEDAELPPETIDTLMRYHWPGNVRELRNFVEAAIAFGDAAENLEPDPAAEPPSSMAYLFEMPYRDARERAIRDFQVAYLSHAIEAAGGNLTRTAELTSMNRPHLMQLLKRLKLR